MNMRISPTGPIWEAAKAERNWLVFRLQDRSAEGKKPSKKPVDPTITGAPVRDRDQCARFTYDEAIAHAEASGEGHGIGYLPRPGSAMIIIDLDGVMVDEALTEEGDALLGPDPIETYCEISPSGTGLHLLCTRDEHFWPVATIDDSLNPVGLFASGSVFVSITEDHAFTGETREVATPPGLWARLMPGLEARLAERERVDDRDPAAEAGDSGWFDRLTPEDQEDAVTEMLEVLPVEICRERSTWLRVTFALRDHPHLFELWDAWSRLGGGTSYDPEGNEEVWSGRDRGEAGTRVGMGTLIHMAEQAGAKLGRWKGARPRHQRLAQRLQELVPEVREEAERVERIAAEVDEELVLYLPSMTAQGERWMHLGMPDTLEGVPAKMMPRQAIDLFYGQNTARDLRPHCQATSGVPVIDPRLPFGFTPTGHHGGREIGVVNKLRLRSVATKPLGEDAARAVQAFESVLRQVFPVEGERAWFRQWLAFKVRHPHERMVAAVSCALTQGTGRGGLALILRKLFADPVAVRNMSMSNVSGDTSQWSQWLTALLVIIDEADPAEEAGVGRRSLQSRKGYERLKDVVDPGEKWIEVNIKGGATYQAQSFTSFFICTNSPDALPLPEGDRRFAVLEGNEHRADDAFYHTCQALAGSEASLDALWWWLHEEVDVAGFDPAIAPASSAKAHMVQSNKTELDEEIEDMIAGPLKGCPFVHPEILIDALTHHGHVGKEMSREGKLRGAVARWMRDNTAPFYGPQDAREQKGAKRLRVDGHRQARIGVLRSALSARPELEVEDVETVRQRLETISPRARRDADVSRSKVVDLQSRRKPEGGEGET